MDYGWCRIMPYMPLFGVLDQGVTMGTVWTYIGTSGTYNGSVNYISPSSCSTSGTVNTWLTSTYPPSNYENGYQMRVNTWDSNNNNCGYMFFRAD